MNTKEEYNVQQWENIFQVLIFLEGRKSKLPLFKIHYLERVNLDTFKKEAKAAKAPLTSCEI